jgi:hypothetical protein
MPPKWWGTGLPYGLQIRRTGYNPPHGPSEGWWVGRYLSKSKKIPRQKVQFSLLLYNKYVIFFYEIITFFCDVDEKLPQASIFNKHFDNDS